MQQAIWVALTIWMVGPALAAAVMVWNEWLRTKAENQ